MSNEKALIESSKKLAAYQAVEENIVPLLSENPNLKVGIGSGSTVIYVVERLAQLSRSQLDNMVFLPTSFQAKQLILENNLTLGSLDSVEELDVVIDGADEVDDKLNAIKGGGACQLQEKVVASIAKKFVLVADFRKDSKLLGEQWLQGVPIEVAPFAITPVINQIKKLNGQPTLRMSGGGKAGPVITDNGNFVVDANFKLISNPEDLEIQLLRISGVVEVGLFCNMAQVAYFGNQDGTVTRREP